MFLSEINHLVLLEKNDWVVLGPCIISSMPALLSWHTAAVLAVLYSFRHSFIHSVNDVHAIRTCVTAAQHSGDELGIIEHASD